MFKKEDVANSVERRLGRVHGGQTWQLSAAQTRADFTEQRGRKSDCLGTDRKWG